jgi:F-type H+-transporting ATPase subunit b
MELLRPDLGLIFWMMISFLLLLFILTKFGWKPILGALKEREKSIDNALKSAENAKEEMKKLQADNEKLFQSAQKEKDNMLKEAREVKEKMLQEAKEHAANEAKKIIDAARLSIQNEKVAAINEIKIQVASLSVDIAEKLLRRELDDAKKQGDYINDLTKDIKLN